MSNSLWTPTLSAVLAASLLLPTQLAIAAPPDAEPDTEAESGDPEARIGGAYGESVDYDWDGGDAPAPPSSGPRVEIEVQNGIRPVYLQRLGGGDPVEVCEAPCGAQIGDASGQFILAGPGRTASKPFSLSAGDSLTIRARGGNPKLRGLGIALFPIAGVIAVGLVIVPTQLNMPFGAGVGFWATAGAVALVGAGTGITLIRFSRTQVEVLPG